MEKTMNNEATATEDTGKDAFRARLITHLNQAEIEVVDRLLDAAEPIKAYDLLLIEPERLSRKASH